MKLNHEEAKLLAEMRQGDSNLARCYLDLLEQLKQYKMGYEGVQADAARCWEKLAVQVERVKELEKQLKG